MGPPGRGTTAVWYRLQPVRTAVQLYSILGVYFLAIVSACHTLGRERLGPFTAIPILGCAVVAVGARERIYYVMLCYGQRDPVVRHYGRAQ